MNAEIRKKLICEASLYKKGIYSNLPEVPKRQLAAEAAVAKLEFSRVVEKENQRLELVAKLENERILKKLKEQDEDEVACCPLCLEDLQIIHTREKPWNILGCCGVRICCDCSQNWLRNQETHEVICFSCRRPALRKDYNELSLNGNRYGRAYAFSALATK